MSAAIVVADHRTGDILASLGSAELTNTERNGYVDMTDAVRSPGSTLKPLIYGLAFEQRLAHPQTLIDDAPVGWGSYRPQNFDRGFRGTVLVREALAQSLNIPALLLLDAVGPARLLARMKRAGMAPRISQPGRPPGLAIGLGGLGVSLRDLVRLYGSLARNGRPLGLHEIVGDHGSTRREPGQAQPVIAAAAAWQVSRILLRSPPPDSAIAGRIAYKTGTSYGYRDAWSLGYDGRVVVGVWVGRPDGRPVTGLTGRSAAAPLLFDTFARLGRPLADLVAPPTRVATAIPADAPAALAHFRVAGRPPGAPRALRIAYPPDGARVDLGLADAAGPGDLLAVKISNGEPPFTWLVDGRPVATGGFRRHLAWPPTGPGATTITVIDASGRSDRVSVFLE
jgi:penicillin-binding protein 1C